MKKIISFLVILFIPTVSLIIAIYTIDHYGINWDEPYHFRRGQAFLHYFLTGKKTYEGMPKYPPLAGTTDSPGFRNSDELFREVQKNPSLSDSNFRRSYYQDDAWNGEYFIDIENPYGHPSLNDVLAATFNRVFYQKLDILGDLESYHLFIILTVSLASFFVAIFMWREYGAVESIVTSLALATYPLILGEQHFNVKDPIETSFYTITIISFFLGITRKSLLWLFISTLGFALGLSTKFNIIFSLIPMGVWFIVIKTSLSKKIVLTLMFAPIVIFGILLLSYPTLWKNPIAGILQIAKFYLEVGHSMSQPTSYYVWGFINTYPSQWILYTTPPATIFLFLISLVFIRKIIRKNSFSLLVIAWFFIALGRISLFGALSYGGVRLIMEFIPAMAMLAGISAGYIVKQRETKFEKVAICLLIILGFTPTLVKLVKIHPNENVYFNFLIGGLSGAKERNLNSWGNSNGNAYFSAIEWLNRNAEKDARLTLPVNLIGNVPRYKLRPDIALSNDYWSGPKHLGEYVVELTYDYPPKDWYSLKYLNIVMEPIYEVGVDDVPIVKVWKNDEKFVKAEFKKQEKIKVNANRLEDKNLLLIELPIARKIMQVSILLPSKNCSPIETGYVRISTDGESWMREPEDIALDQIKPSKIREDFPNFDFYFVARDAKSIIFETKNSDACLLKGRDVEVTVLKEV